MCHFPSVLVGLPAAGRRQRVSHLRHPYMKMKTISNMPDDGPQAA
jgi:hypothetical protein